MPVNMKMSRHLLKTLGHLSQAATNEPGGSGFHFGSLKALVDRGLAETFISYYGTEYRITQLGRFTLKSKSLAGALEVMGGLRSLAK